MTDDSDSVCFRTDVVNYVLNDERWRASMRMKREEDQDSSAELLEKSTVQATNVRMDPKT